MGQSRRLASDRCGSCVFYDGDTEASGLCRRRVPYTPTGESWEDKRFEHWPTVSSEDWCGEFQRIHRKRDTRRGDV